VPGVVSCGSAAELVARTDVDIVAVCSPTALHAEQALLAIEAGKHVVVEKPPAATAAGLIELAEAADARGVLLSVVSQQRFLPHPRYAAAVLASGRLGRLLLGEVRLHWRRPQSYYDQAPWRATDPQGGSLANQGWHAVDLLTSLCGPAIAVAGHAATLAHRVTVEDTTVAAIRFANAALGTIVTTTAAPDGEPSVVEVLTERAHIQFTDAEITRWDVPAGVPAPPATAASGGGGANDPTRIEFEPHRLQWTEVVGAVQGRQQLTVTARDALSTLELIEAVYRSSSTRAVAALPQR
jgi:UDP-N-acetyl-2-amino-2-deoxyglucuronate dehydrogenase